MSFTKIAFNVLTATFKIDVIFEIVDNPDDKSEFQSAIKPVNIHYKFFKSDYQMTGNEEKDVKESKKGKCIRAVTKNTDKRLRKITDYYFDNVLLIVVAEPADGWDARYENCVKTVSLKPGDTVNFTISLPKKYKH